jgi:hypothetical protein
VLLRDVGEGSSALYCLTNSCSAETGRNRGAWRLPNAASVGENTAAEIYLTRGFSSIHLNRRSSAVGQTGVYTCTIPDAGNVLRILSVAILEGQLNEWYCSVHMYCHLI